MSNLMIPVSDFAMPLAQLMLPNNLSQESQWYAKQSELLGRKHQALADWLVETGFQPFPFPESIVLIDRGAGRNIPSWLITVWKVMNVAFPITIITGTERNDRGQVVLSGNSINLNTQRVTWMGQVVPAGKLATEELLEVEADDLAVYQDELADWYATFIAEQLDALSLEQVAQLLTIIGDAEVADEGVFVFAKNNAEYSVDLANRVVTTRSMEYTALAKCSLGKAVISSRLVLSTLLIHFARKQFNGSVDDLLNRLPNVWEREPNYGIEWESDHPTRLIAEDSRLSVAFRERDKGAILACWPFILPAHEDHNPEQIDRIMADEGDAIPDKYNIKALSGSMGSLAAGMAAVTVDGIRYKRSIHEQKQSKAYSRPRQARTLITAMAEVIRADGSVGGRERSLFRVDLQNGQEAAQYGVRLRTLYTNNSCLFGMSSGEAALHPGVQIKTSIKKTKMLVVNFDGLPAAVRQALKGGADKTVGKARLTELLTTSLDSLIDSGRFFEDGEEILGLHEAGVDHVFMTHRGVNQPMRVHSYQLAPKAKGFQVFESEEVRIKVKFSLEVTDQFWKLRNDGVKFTTTPMEVQFKDDNGADLDIQWELLLPMESVKGRLLSMIGYAYDQGGAIVDVAKGELTSAAGKIDLLNPHNPVYDWLKDKVKTVWIQSKMAKAEYDVLIQARGQHDDLVVVEEHDTYVVLREQVQMLEMDAVYEVELSSPREKSTSSQMTLEMLAGMGMQCPKLAEAINAESKDYRRGVEGLIQMINGKSGLGEVDVCSPIGRAFIKSKVGEIQHLEGSQIVRQYAKAFPQGLSLKGVSNNGNVNLFLDFNVVLGMSTFIGKVGDGIASDIVAMLSYISEPAESGNEGAIYSKLVSLKRGMDSWLQKSMQSNKIMKRLARTKPGSMHTLVVRTLALPELHNEPGQLPKLAINPNDQILKELAKGIDGKLMPQFVSGPQSMNGAYIGCGRTPMIMLGAFQLVVTNKVSIGHAALLPHCWAMLCEGDADGDTINVLSLTKYGIEHDECLTINDSVLGMKGYKVAYGKDPSGWPCAEFSAYSDKWGKKALVFEPGSKTEAKNLMPYVYTQTMEQYIAGAKLVAGHYRGPVGISYNVCVVMTHRTLDLFYLIQANQDKWDADRLKREQNRLALYQMSMAVAWRLLYEGLGLAGYSPAAKEFFNLLHIATFQQEYTYAQVDGIWQPAWIDPKKKPVVVRNCIDDLVYLGGHRDMSSNDLVFKPEGGIEHLSVARAIVRELIGCNRIAQDAGAIVKGRDRVSRMDANARLKAILYFSLRHIGRGHDPAGQAEMEAYESAGGDEVLPTSLINACMVDGVYKLHACPWVKALLVQACSVHMNATEILYRINHSEE